MISNWTRRGFLAAGGAALAGCTSIEGSSDRAQTIDRRVDSALQFLDTNVDGARDLESKAAGVLIIPLITEASFAIGGSYGDGALRINGVTVDYYAVAQGSWGIQIGAQQFAQALYFMTPEALSNFRSGNRFSVGGDVKITTLDAGDSLNVDSLTTLDPIVGIVFGQAGILAGASIEGTVYTRIDV